jgi:hypothetical protein
VLGNSLSIYAVDDHSVKLVAGTQFQESRSGFSPFNYQYNSRCVVSLGCGFVESCSRN